MALSAVECGHNGTVGNKGETQGLVLIGKVSTWYYSCKNLGNTALADVRIEDFWQDGGFVRFF